VSIPVLAKEFVVDARQFSMVRAAGADIVLLLAVLHPADALAALVRQAFELGLEPLVEAHDEAELDAALSTDARLIGVNNRDLRTLEVDTERADRLRAHVPDDRIVIAESGVRDASTIRRWRALGFDAALVGEALMRSDDARAEAAAFVAAGRQPDDPANVARRPFVKICGVTDALGVQAAVRAGADAIGLNIVPGTPRALSTQEAHDLAAVARAAGHPGIVLITADAPDALLDETIRAVDPDAIQYTGSESIDRVVASQRSAWRALHLSPGGSADEAVATGRTLLERGVERLLIDTAGGPYPGGTGVRADPTAAIAIAREVPVVLAGGLGPANVAHALRDIAAVGVDVSSGVEAPRIDGERPVKDPFKVALFVKRAKAARDDRPNTAFGPTPVHAGLLDVDRRDGGAWNATSAGDTFQRPSWRRSSSSRPRMTRCATTRSSGRTSGSFSPDTRGGRRPSTARTVWPRRPERRRSGWGVGPSRRSASISSARTSPIRGPTRSTTRSARRCSPGVSESRG
jgi:indole-3-glycerol phosphate synthase